jgi:hypothetical protein
MQRGFGALTDNLLLPGYLKKQEKEKQAKENAANGN